jgi:thiol-disulfide isomerase/thioredoxin
MLAMFGGAITLPDTLAPSFFQEGLRVLDGPKIGYIGGAASADAEILIINFWASWCDACVAEQPELNRTHTEFTKDYGGTVEIIGVNVGESENKVRRYLHKYEVEYTTVLGWPSPPPGPKGQYPYTVILVPLGQGSDGHI